MQVWSEQGAGQPEQPKIWRAFGWWPRERSAEEQLRGRWAKLAHKLDRECEALRRRMEQEI